MVTIGGQPYLVVLGGGHLDGSWNGILKFGPLTGTGSETPTWTLWFAASAVGDVTINSPTYADGRQSSMHTYNNMVGVGSDLYHMATHGYYNNTGNSSNLAFRTSDGSPVTQVARATNINASLFGAFDHWNGKIYGISGNGGQDILRVYNIASNSWSSESNGEISLQNYVAIACDTNRGKAYVSNGTDAYYWDLTSLSRTTKNSPAGWEDTILYDPIRDVFVVPVAGAAEVKELSASALVSGSPSWTTRTFTGTAPTGLEAFGTFGRWRYVAGLRGYILVPNESSDVWFFKA